MSDKFPKIYGKVTDQSILKHFDKAQFSDLIIVNGCFYKKFNLSEGYYFNLKAYTKDDYIISEVKDIPEDYKNILVYEDYLKSVVPSYKDFECVSFDSVLKDKKFTRQSNYMVNVDWDYLETFITRDNSELCKFDLDPDFQRAHVWKEEQQIAYIEYIMRGGMSGKDIFFNCSSWEGKYNTPVEIVDGKQRLEAVRRFMNGEIKAFGLFVYQYNYITRDCRFNVHINNLKTRKEVLQWYLDLNSGGVLHTKEELEKVEKLLKESS